MSDISNLDYTDFFAGQTAGEGMLIATPETPLSDIQSWVFTDRVLWFYDGERYRIVIQFEAVENGANIYFFNNDGTVGVQGFGDS